MKRKTLYIFTLIILIGFSNLFWSILGVIMALIHMPRSIDHKSESYAIIIRVQYT
jgi:hypothetical protein